MSSASPQKLKNNSIISKFLNPSLTSHFICRFQPPSGMNGFLSQREAAGWKGSAAYNSGASGDQELIEISCSEASLPGSSLMTNEINDDFTGVTERNAYRRQYDDRMDFTFYVDSNYKIINFFESWIAYSVGENNFKEVGLRNYSYRMNFPDDYQTDSLYVTKFDRNHKNSIEYNFIRAYPISIASMPVSYESSQLLKCTVSFTYIRYVVSNRKLILTPEPKQQTSTGVSEPLSGSYNTPGSTLSNAAQIVAPQGTTTTIGGIEFQF